MWQVSIEELAIDDVVAIDEVVAEELAAAR
jgi:hypothetical protein